MELPTHGLKDLFDQLGLPSSNAEIDGFIAAHRPLPERLRLHEAPFWSKSQAQFLREEIAEDADWAELVDELDAMLRA
jgi:hypothetical protein